eukprot:364403-Chlamydomonas_euryale.AAC.11
MSSAGHDQRVNQCPRQAMGEHGAQALLAAVAASGRAGVNGRVRVLTHCNTGSLATSGFGTALGVIRALHEQVCVELGLRAWGMERADAPKHPQPGYQQLHNASQHQNVGSHGGLRAFPAHANNTCTLLHFHKGMNGDQCTRMQGRMEPAHCARCVRPQSETMCTSALCAPAGRASWSTRTAQRRGRTTRALG